MMAFEDIKKSGEHTEYVLSHKLDAFKNTVKTSYRMPLSLREAFNEKCARIGLKTCFVIRSLMYEWLKTPPQRPTAVRFEKWIYDRPLQSLMKVDSKGRYVAHLYRKRSLK